MAGSLKTSLARQQKERDEQKSKATEAPQEGVYCCCLCVYNACVHVFVCVQCVCACVCACVHACMVTTVKTQVGLQFRGPPRHGTVCGLLFLPQKDVPVLTHSTQEAHPVLVHWVGVIVLAVSEDFAYTLCLRVVVCVVVVRACLCANCIQIVCACCIRTCMHVNVLIACLFSVTTCMLIT